VTSRLLLICRRVVAHWRAIVLVSILAPGAFFVIHPDELSLLLALLLIFIASQIFWIRRVVDLGEWLLPRRVCRKRVAMAVVLAYLFVVRVQLPDHDRARTHLPHRVLPVASHRDGSGVLVVVCRIDAGLSVSDRFRLA